MRNVFYSPPFKCLLELMWSWWETLHRDRWTKFMFCSDAVLSSYLEAVCLEVSESILLTARTVRQCEYGVREIWAPLEEHVYCHWRENTVPCKILPTLPKSGITCVAALTLPASNQHTEEHIAAVLTYNQDLRARDLKAPEKAAQHASFMSSASSANIQCDFWYPITISRLFIGVSKCKRFVLTCHYYL